MGFRTVRLVHPKRDEAREMSKPSYTLVGQGQQRAFATILVAKESLIGRPRPAPALCHGMARRFVLCVRANVEHYTDPEVLTVRRSEAVLGTAVVAVSATVNAAHTVSHAGQHVTSLPAWQLAYIAIVVYSAPVVAAVLLWTRSRRSGAWLLAASMAGSLLFGLLYHFLVPGPDNVFAHPPGSWKAAFVVTAVLLALLQAAGALVGIRVALGTRQTASTSTGRRVTHGFSDVR